MRLIKPDNYQPEEMYLSKVAHAISHPIRTRILELLADRKVSTRVELCCYFKVSKVALYNHVRILKNSDLIVCNYNVHFEDIQLNNAALSEMKQFLVKMSGD